MSDWKTMKLGGIALINYGYTTKANHDFGTYKILRITDIQDGFVNWNTVPFCEVETNKLKKYLLYNGDIVFARTGATTGKSFLVKNPINAVFASYLIRLSVNKDIIIPEFIFYFFQSKKYWEQIHEGISGAAQGGFNASKLTNISLCLPPLPEQQRIVAKLNTSFTEIDTAITATEKKQEEVNKLKQAILTKALQPSKPSAKAWQTAKLEDVVQKTETVNPTKDADKSFIYIDVSSINRDTLTITEVQQLLGKDAPSRARKLVRQGDIIFATIRPTLKRIAFIPNKYDKQICSTGYIVLRPNYQFLHSNFLFYFMQSNKVMYEMKEMETGASYPAVTDKQVRELNISYPSLPEQKRIAAKLDTAFTEIDNFTQATKKKIANHKALKSAILTQELQPKNKNQVA